MKKKINIEKTMLFQIYVIILKINYKALKKTFLLLFQKKIYQIFLGLE